MKAVTALFALVAILGAMLPLFAPERPLPACTMTYVIETPSLRPTIGD